MTIKQSVINTFNRVGIDYQALQAQSDLVASVNGNQPPKVTVCNRFGGGSCETTPLVAYLIEWVYQTSNAYERGDNSVNVSDFDRIRYFILDTDSNAYDTCID